jgi:endonuclease YncB( thermonuclease family)
MYYQAALPQAQAEAQEARQALFSQLTNGGVLGPTLARGERRIGG